MNEQTSISLGGRNFGEIVNQILTDNTLKAATRTVATRAAIQIGADLLEVKKRVPHGEWGEWLKEHVDYSERTAQQLMQLTKEYATADQSFLDRVSVSQALAMVSLTPGEREKLLDENEGASTRELKEAVRRIQEERDALQVRIDQLEGHGAPAELPEEYLKRLEDLNAEIDEKQRQLDRVMAERNNALEQAEAYADSMRELQERLYSLTDKEAENRAAEAEGKYRDAMEKVRNAEQAQKSLEEKAQKIEARSAQQEQEIEKLKAELTEAKSRPVSGELNAADEERIRDEARFRETFATWKGSAEKLINLIAHLSNVEDKAKFGKAFSLATRNIAEVAQKLTA